MILQWEAFILILIVVVLVFFIPMKICDRNINITRFLSTFLAIFLFLTSRKRSKNAVPIILFIMFLAKALNNLKTNFI